MKAQTFLSGKPCRNGHLAPRLVSNGFCVECRRVTMGKYRQANRERDRAYQIARRVLQKDRIRAQARAYRQRNREKVRARTAAYQRANPIAVAANNQRRISRRANAPGRGVSSADWRSCLAESLGLCAYCSLRKSLEFDHIQPLSRGGAHDPENIAAACVSCNRSKQNTPLLLWLAKQALLRRVA